MYSENIQLQRERIKQDLEDKARQDRKARGIETKEDVIYDIKILESSISGKSTTSLQELKKYRAELEELMRLKKAAATLQFPGSTLPP